jgi:hypothetical protein
MTETMHFIAYLAGLFLLSVVVLILAFSVAIRTARWQWPAGLRALSFAAITGAYAAWLLWTYDELWLYRAGALAAALATYRFSRGFAKTFLPSFIEAFKAARNKGQG